MTECGRERVGLCQHVCECERAEVRVSVRVCRCVWVSVSVCAGECRRSVSCRSPRSEWTTPCAVSVALPSACRLLGTERWARTGSRCPVKGFERIPAEVDALEAAGPEGEHATGVDEGGGVRWRRGSRAVGVRRDGTVVSPPV